MKDEFVEDVGKFVKPPLISAQGINESRSVKKAEIRGRADQVKIGDVGKKIAAPVFNRRAATFTFGSYC